MRQKNVNKIKDSKSSELLFYSLINALAYSKFADVITVDVEKKTQDKNAKTIKDFYRDFVKNKVEFSNMFGEELFQNIILIVDEFCQEKLKEFLKIGASGTSKEDANKQVKEFFNYNIENIDGICLKYQKHIIKTLQKENPTEEELKNIFDELQGQEPFYILIKSFIDNLQHDEPKKLQELISFEINKITLKDSSNIFKYVVKGGDMELPASTFLIRAKEASKLKRFGQEKVVQNNFCAIS